MAIVLDGKALSKKINTQTAQKVDQMKQQFNFVPRLEVILVGDNKASQRYVRNKQRVAERLGINSSIIRLPATTSQNELLNQVSKLNNDPAVTAILVQDPLPKQIDEKLITRSILPEKDVDGFNPENVGKLFLNDSTNYPVACTPKGIMSLLAEYNIEVVGKQAVVIGRSAIVGKPMAALLLNAGATVSIVHRNTPDITEYTKSADIIVCATGQLHTLKKGDAKAGSTVIDVGQNMNENNKLAGDVDYDDLFKNVGFITPVPGGVGPMTIATLMQQTVELVKWRQKLD